MNIHLHPLRLLAVSTLLAVLPGAHAQLYTGTNSTGLWSSARWSSDTNGPFTGAWVANSATLFLADNTYTFTGGGTVDIGNITVQTNTTVTFSAASGTLGTGGNVRTIDVGSGSLLDLNVNALSTAAGVGFIKTGDGVYATGTGTYQGGFTLNGGTVVIRGTTGLGSGATNILTISNGVFAANSTRTMDSTRFGGGINIRGDFQLGALSNNYAVNAQSLISDTANLSFSNATSLGAATRTITVGGNGTYTLGGTISGDSGGVGLTVTNVTGATGLLNLTASNSFAGTTTVSGGRLQLAGAVSNSFMSTNIVINGGTLSLSFSGAQNMITNTAKLTISSGGFNSADRNQTLDSLDMSGGFLTRSGFGVLAFSGASTITGGSITNTGTNSDVRFLGGLTLGGASIVYSNTNNASQGIVRMSNNLTYSATNTVKAEFTNFTNGIGRFELLGTGGTNTFDIGDGSAAIDLDISWSIVGSVTLRKAGGGVLVLSGSNTFTNLVIDGGTLRLSGTNTYDGNTTVSTGTLELATNASLRFVIGGSGTNNAVLGSGTTAMNGRFDFDLTSASTNTNATWTIVAGTLSNTYGANFLVSGFSGVTGGNWTNTTNGVNYVFSQSNSVLSVQSTGSVTPYNSWVAYWQGVDPNFTNTAGTANPDGDPFVNNMEFAFDGNPTVGTPALLSAVKSGSNAVFSYVALTNPTAATYAMQISTNLATGGWTNASVTISNSANQTGISQTNIYQRKEFTVPATAAEFYRVRAVIAP